MTEIVTWYIHGLSGKEAPETFDDLLKKGQRRSISADVLMKTNKWDYLIRENIREESPGFIRLGALAKTKRGIATGANNFFHISQTMADAHKIQSDVLIPCVGRAADVNGFEFTKNDFFNLVHNKRRSLLVVFGNTLTNSDLTYIANGEAAGLNKRYLLAARHPWYSMETQSPAPIWAAVFGRKGLRFIRNKANALTLTTFHCVYPIDSSSDFSDALTLCLNVPSIQANARAHTRVYGGGLLKFEPKDLLEIQIPDLRNVSVETLRRLAIEHNRISTAYRNKNEEYIDWTSAESAVKSAAEEASLLFQE